MAIPDKVFSLISKVIRIISLKNVAIWSLTGLFSIVGWTVFENRVALVNYAVHGREQDAPAGFSFSISDTTKSRVKQLVNSNQLINGIVILNADIRNNNRFPLFWFSDDQTLLTVMNSLFTGRYGGIPLFTSDEKNNASVVSVINGEFVCKTYDESGVANWLPGVSRMAPYVCKSSLPPYYGQFSGYVAITLSRIPTAGELDDLKTEAQNISTEIYFRDVLPTLSKK